MEEVIGSIPIRSTNLVPSFGAAWRQFRFGARAHVVLSHSTLNSSMQTAAAARSVRLAGLVKCILAQSVLPRLENSGRGSLRLTSPSRTGTSPQVATAASLQFR